MLDTFAALPLCIAIPIIDTNTSKIIDAAVAVP
jgi:hypothetical protein